MRSAVGIVAAMVAGCGGSSSAGDDPGGDASALDSSIASDGATLDSPVIDGPTEVASDGAADAPTADDDVPFAKKRASCTFTAGAKPSDTFGPSIASAAIPIDVIVIAMQENRSFDHYFSALPGYGQPDVDVAADTLSLPSGTGTAKRFHQADYCTVDCDHSWKGQHADYNGGKNDQFVNVNAPGGARTLGWFDQTDLPFYYALASSYGIGDRHFCSVLAPTFPNRLYLYEGTSSGHTSNVTTAAGDKTIFAALTAAKITWKVYSYSTTQPLESVYGASFVTKFPGAVVGFSTFATDAAAGKLPQVAFVDAPGSEHPPEDPQVGQANIAKAFNALTSSPQWARSAFILTYDENGGYHDHVPPPSACLPDAIKPIGDTGAFDRYGFRVPFLVASPWSKPHHVSHVVGDHTSILRFLELRFGLPALSARDANAEALLDYFDFSAPHFSTPATMPKAVVDPAHTCP